jgi:hypothetical protein
MKCVLHHGENFNKGSQKTGRTIDRSEAYRGSRLSIKTEKYAEY